ncbi:guanine nucleotide exchange factor [Multifurca ochricompacta]|uniref:Guanine nucleotide exchange factor n=1 Tax=Multifurca ochricompacta TaxID=376703 RepID=A0AAD4M5K4_9AGAM|nr:guanine nucleotide exchange factor [Multifurca ochricompacta]
MADILASYNALSPSSPRGDVSKVLNAIATIPIIDNASREALIIALLSDVGSCKPGSTSGRLHHTDAHLALSAIKSLGRQPSGSSVIASAQNLSTLLVVSKSLKDSNLEASLEGLRCIANALLLIESARASLISDSVNGGEYAILLLEKSSSPDVIFIASRILFLATASSITAGSFIVSIVERKSSGRVLSLVDIISIRLESLTNALLGGAKMAREAMVDLLKFSFNILTHYPKLVDCEEVVELGTSGDGAKVMGEYWSDRLDGLLPPLLRAFNTLPPGSPSPLAPPLNHAIHALLAIPYIKSLQAIWLPSHSYSRRGSPTSGPNSPISPGGSSLASDPPRETSRHHGAFDRAKHMLTAGRRSLSRSSSPARSPTPPNHDTLLHTYGLLEVALSHYFPGTIEPDDASVRATAKTESESTMDELLAPLLMLLLKLVAGDTNARERVREWLLPANLDRTVVLESRADTLGRLLRLLTSVYHTRLNSISGELLYALCNHDATILISQMGYGNVAGFLFNKGIVTGPPSSGATSGPIDTSGAQINPITGAIQEERAEIEMTEEERESEAEKLFVLFDRLERTGAVPPEANPVRRAIQRSFAS